MKLKKRRGIVLSLFATSCILPNLALAQVGIQMQGNWASPPEGSTSHRHIITRLKCPETLVENFSLHHGIEYSASNVSCTYWMGNSNNILSIYYYDAAETQQQEIATISRPILNEKSAGGHITQTTPSIILGGVASQAIRLEATRAGSNIYDSITLMDRDDFRLKIRQTYRDNSSAIDAAAAEFAAMQQEAVANRTACAAMPEAPRRAARLAKGMDVAIMGSLFANLTSSTTVSPETAAVTPCYITYARGGNDVLVLKYQSGSYTLSVEGSNDAPLISLLNARPLGDITRSDVAMILTSQQEGKTFVFRGYKTIPTLEQIMQDMVSALRGTLAPLAEVSQEEGRDQNKITIFAPNIEAEDRGQRNAPRQ